MKQITLIIASLLFSTLFYDQHLGLNLLLFSILTIGLLYAFNHKSFQRRFLWFYSLAYLITAILVFTIHSNLAVITNVVAFVTLVGAVSHQKTAIYVNWINGIYTSIAGLFHRNFEVDKSQNKVDWKKDIDVLQWAKLIGIPLLFVILFIVLYKNGNPIFNEWVSKINFDFINLQWILFSILGYYLLSNISAPISVEPATSIDVSTSNTLSRSGSITELSSEEVEKQLKKESHLGTTLIGLLNALILIFIVTDVLFLVSDDTSSASALSSQVHNGINTLIASIIVAIVIILYVFRGNLNFYVKNGTLKHLTYLWIFLNIVLIVLIALKNQNYITAFGLTYKRIGVHIYILMAFMGLVTTFMKVINVKNLLFLFRTNTQIAFVILMLCSAVNWDKIITIYNLKYANSYDIEYLISLSDQNAVPLHALKNTVTISEDAKQRIAKKLERYITRLNESNWQEYTAAHFEDDYKIPQRP